ncbi:MAG TPA: hypothetical protein VIJ25_20905, partial [Methylococcales bacterium]
LGKSPAEKMRILSQSLLNRAINYHFIGVASPHVCKSGIYFKIHGKYKCHQNALTAAQKV